MRVVPFVKRQRRIIGISDSRDVIRMIVIRNLADLTSPAVR